MMGEMSSKMVTCPPVERSKNLGTLIFVHYRRLSPFGAQVRSLLMATTSVTERPRRGKIADVADVQEIKYAISENERFAFSAQTFTHPEQFILAQKLFDHLNNNLA
jgi:hypothetical protein